MADLIDRQAAIDALMHTQEVYSNNFGNDPIDKYTIALIANDIETIVKLPSAQPVLTCKGCKYDYYECVQCRNCLRKDRDLYEPE